MVIIQSNSQFKANRNITMIKSMKIMLYQRKVLKDWQN